MVPTLATLVDVDCLLSYRNNERLPRIRTMSQKTNSFSEKQKKGTCIESKHYKR